MRMLLDRVERDAEVVGASRLAATAERTIAHFSAGDRGRADPVELWGTRIGRLLGLCGFIALGAYLLYTYVLR